MKGVLATVSGLTLTVSPHRESDRLAVVFTDEYGKVPVRFIGVERPAAKLRAFSEPMVRAEFRFYVRDGAEFCVAAGGALSTVYPGIRTDLDATVRGLGVCELLHRLTPSWRPAPDKLALACEALDAIERVASDPGADGERRQAGYAWLVSAFALRLFESAGYGLRARRVSAENRTLWELLHGGAWSELAALPPDPERESRLRTIIEGTVERVAEKPLRFPALVQGVKKR
ncbi:MAG: hypothetical protein A2X36_04775 [Elusimicrobia bacterium GWA2_69_24]|nr:MAG: hypothetical protein A2X36_04775 [Elusimicrobia bacterium GWA2_69_24]HBL17515.1 hypothetical protein [Elusimicrobiota bacterium]